MALISDASNREIARLNARAQHFRAERGELGEWEVEVPGVPYGVGGRNQVAMIGQHHAPGEERVENGSLGEIVDFTESGAVLIEFDATGQRRTLVGEVRADPPGLRPAHPPGSGCDGDPRPDRHGWLADEQGAAQWSTWRLLALATAPTGS